MKNIFTQLNKKIGVKYKISVFFLIISTLIVFWVAGTLTTLSTHEDKYILNAKKLMIIDVENDIKNFDRNKLCLVYRWYITGGVNKIEDFLVKKITVKKGNKGYYVTEGKTFFNIKIEDDYGMPKSIDSIKNHADTSYCSEFDI